MLTFYKFNFSIAMIYSFGAVLEHLNKQKHLIFPFPLASATSISNIRYADWLLPFPCIPR